MFKFITLIASGLLALISLSIFAAPTAASDIETFRTAPIWYLEFEVSFKGSYKDSAQEGIAKTSTSISLDGSFSAMWPLDIRSDGPSTVLSASYLSSASDSKTPTVAEQIKMAQEMMARMETAANWMRIGGTSEGGMEADMGPAKFDYLRVDIGENQPDETGDLYNRNIRTTRKGSGMVFPGGGASITFEIDAAAKKYQLALPHGFNPMTTMMTQETITIFGAKGETPTETKKSSQIELSFYPGSLTFDEQKDIQAGMPLIKGDIDLSKEKISGERTIAAHYDDKYPLVSVPVTITFRYTLSMTPPPVKPAAKGK